MASVKQINVNDTLYDIQSIEYIIGTQTSATNSWKGTSKSVTLETGKVIAYKLNQAGTTSPATLTLTLANNVSSGAKNIKMNGTESVTNQFPVNTVLLMLYDGTNWQLLGGGSAGDTEIVLVTDVDTFVKEVTPTTASISVDGVNLIIGSTTMVTSVTTTTGVAVTSVSSDSDIESADIIGF